MHNQIVIISPAGICVLEVTKFMLEFIMNERLEI